MAIEKISIEIKSNAKEIEKQLAAIDAKINKLKAQKIKIQISADELETAENKLSGINAALKELADGKAVINADAGNIEAAKDKMAAVSDQMNHLNGEIAQLNNQKALLQLEQQEAKEADSGKVPSGGLAKVNSEGMLESFGNLGSKASESVTNIMGKFDDLSKKIQGSAIVQHLNSFKDVVSKVFSTAADKVDAVEPYVNKVTDVFERVKTTVKKFEGINFGNGLNGFQEGFEGIKTAVKDLSSLFGGIGDGGLGSIFSAITEKVDAVEQYVTKFKQFFEQIQTTIQNFGNISFENGLKEGFEGIMTALEGLSSLSGGTGEGGLGSVFSSIMDKVDAVKPYITKCKDVFEQIKSAVKNFGNISFGNGLKEGFDGIKSSIKGFWDTVGPIIDLIKNKLPDLGKLSDFKLPSLFGGKGEGGEKGKSEAKSAVSGAAQSAASAASGAAQGAGASGGVSQGLNIDFDVGKMLNQAKNMGLVFGVVKIIQEAAQALKDINDKVPSDIGSMVPKLLNMGIAIGAMGGLVAIAGKLAQKNPEAAALGLAAIALISLDLMLAAEAVSQISEKVPNDIAAFAPKMINMGIAIGGMGALVLAAGKLAAKNPVDAIAGLAAVALISVDLMLAAEAIEQIDQKVPGDIADFAEKMGNVAIAIGGFGVLVGAIGALVATGIGAVIGGAGLLAVAAIAVEMIEVAEAIKRVDEDVPEDLQTVKNKIDLVAEAIGYFTAANLGNVMDIFENAMGAVNIAVVTEGLKKMLDLVDELEKFEGMEIPTGITEKIDEIEEVISSIDGADLDELIKHSIGAVDLMVLDVALQQLIDIGNKLGEFKNIEFDSEATKAKITQIKEMTEHIGDSGGIFSKLKDLVSNAIDTANFAVADEALGQLVSIGNKLVDLQKINFNYDEVYLKVNQLKEIVGIIGDSSFQNLLSSLASLGELAVVNTAMDTFIEIGRKLYDLQAVKFNFAIVWLKLLQVKSIVREIGDSDFVTLLSSLASLGELHVINAALDTFIKIGKRLPEFENMDFDFTNVETRVRQVKEIVRLIGDSDFIELLKGLISLAEIEVVSSALDELKTVISKLNALAQGDFAFDEAKKRIRNLKEIIEEINMIPAAKNVEGLAELIQTVLDTLTELSGLEGEMLAVGARYGENIVTGFTEAQIPVNITNIIVSLIKQLENKVYQFTVIGRKYGQALNKAFTAAVAGMESAVTSQITKMTEFSNQFTALGESFGQKLMDGFRDKISGLSTLIAEEIKKMQAGVDGLTPPVWIKYSSGGEVENHSAGGLAGIFKPRGTDTVPAMLTPGEFVMSKKAVNTFGLDYMKRINNLDVKGMLHSMAGRFSTYTMTPVPVSSTVNNVSTSNINNARVTQHISGGNPDYSMRRVSRHLKVRV